MIQDIGYISSKFNKVIIKNERFLSFIITRFDNTKIPITFEIERANEIVNKLQFGDLIFFIGDLKSEEVMTTKGDVKLRLLIKVVDYHLVKRGESVVLNNDYLSQLLLLEDIKQLTVKSKRGEKR